jgi:hypothetical protein
VAPSPCRANLLVWGCEGPEDVATLPPRVLSIKDGRVTV